MSDTLHKDAAYTFFYTAKLLETTPAAFMDATTHAHLIALATRALPIIDTKALFSGYFAAVQSGAIQSARASGSHALLMATLQEAGRRHHPSPFTISLTLAKLPTQEEAVQALQAAQAAGLGFEAQEIVTTWIEAHHKGWDDLVAQIDSTTTLVHRLSETIHTLLPIIWREPRALRTRMLAFMRDLLMAQPHKMDIALRHAAVHINPMPLLLLLRSPGANLDQAYDTLRRLPKHSPVATLLVRTLASAHGRLAFLSAPWDEHAFLGMEWEQASNIARANTKLPTVRLARRALQAQRQAQRGRTPGPVGGDPARRPTSPCAPRTPPQDPS